MHRKQYRITIDVTLDDDAMDSFGTPHDPDQWITDDYDNALSDFIDKSYVRVEEI